MPCSLHLNPAPFQVLSDAGDIAGIYEAANAMSDISLTADDAMECADLELTAAKLILSTDGYSDRSLDLLSTITIKYEPLRCTFHMYSVSDSSWVTLNALSE